MYEAYFNLSGSPFRLNPDPKFFFGSRSHNKAMAYLHYGLRQAEGFIVITGEIGAGKSMLIGHLIDQLDRTNVVAANLLTSSLEPSALLSHVLSAFRIEPASPGKSAELEAFEDFLFDQMNRGRRVLLIVDEAQNLPLKTIEELRMLSNMDYDGTPLFQVFLVGQPEFRGVLAKPDMEQFRQRVIATYHLEPLAADETRRYIEHRLSVVGWSGDPSISDEAHAAMYAAANGVPRKINTLANRILLYCALEKRHAVDADVVAAVVADLAKEGFSAGEDEALEPDAEPQRRRQAAAGAAAPPAPRKSGGGRGSVVVPFGSVKKPAAAEGGEEKEPASSSMTAVSTGEDAHMSVLDRLRARRAAAGEEAPTSATLGDVARAIAAASAEGGAPQAFDDDDEPAGEAAKGWLAALLKSIGETRGELKAAHAGAQRLRRDLAAADARGTERRKLISERLAKAETLLASLRGAGSDKAP